MNPLISIIIPHKNNIFLLSRLLESIPNHTTFEVIVIDDNSETQHKRNLEKLAETKNFTLICLDNNGFAGKARNLGIKSAKGRWLIFADSDDFFSPNLLELVQPFINREEIDIIYFNVASVDLDNRPSYRHTAYATLVERYPYTELAKLDIRYKYTPPWGKMIRRNFVIDNNIYFDEVPASNDLFFSIRSGHLAKEIAVCSNTLYTITQRPGSITSTISRENILSRFDAAMRVNSFFREHALPQYQHSILYFIYRALKFNPLLSIKLILISLVKHNNPLIGINKIKTAKSALKKRESR